MLQLMKMFQLFVQIICQIFIQNWVFFYECMRQCDIFHKSTNFSNCPYSNPQKMLKNITDSQNNFFFKFYEKNY